MLRASVDLAGEAFFGTVKTVEGVHQSIVGSVARYVPVAHPVGWISGFVYRRVRDVGQLSFAVASQAAGLADMLRPGSAANIPEEARLGLRAALNGAFGDYLEARGNDLALPMSFCADGDVLDISTAGIKRALPDAGGHLVILLHGLCLNDLSWRHAGQPDFGDRLKCDIGATTLRLRYNSGRHISTNGREFADLMEALLKVYPVKLKRLTLIGHSMGGLVARSACYYATKSNHRWAKSLTEVICLGSPHLGAPLERLGHWFTHSLTRTPFTAPLSDLGRIRSAGIKDLRHCNLRDEDWQNQDMDARYASKPRPLPLLENVRYFNVAASLGKSPNDRLDRWFGDILVPVKSATSTPAHRSRRMRGSGQDGRVFFGMSHFALVHDPDVYASIYAWLTGKPQRERRAHKGKAGASDNFESLRKGN